MLFSTDVAASVYNNMGGREGGRDRERERGERDRERERGEREGEGERERERKREKERESDHGNIACSIICIMITKLHLLPGNSVQSMCQGSSEVTCP